MKQISIRLFVSMWLIVLFCGQGFSEDVAQPDTPENVSAVDNTETTAKPAPAAMENESEGEITYSAIPETETPEADASAEEQSDVTVVEARICESINDREPVAPGDVFPSDIESLFCFSRISSDESTEIKHVWYHNGQNVAEVPLSIGASSGWRTFSSKSIRPEDKGAWKVEIITASGAPIKTIQFIVN